MTKEEADNGRDDMLIDNSDAKEMEVDAFPEGFNSSYLKLYYGWLFPHADMSKWMAYGNDGKHPACDESYFGRREFSFTLDNDIYVRFQSFKTAHDLEKAIKEQCPFKIDIGPVYSVEPSKRHAYAQSGDNNFTPVERELVFDIDISDYDDVRYCCSGADVCLDCWPLMTIAIKVIDIALLLLLSVCANSLHLKTQGPPGGFSLGTQLWSNGNPFTVTILPNTAGYTSVLKYNDGHRDVVVGNSKQYGHTFRGNALPYGQEIKFFIDVIQSGKRFWMGPADRNYDRRIHAAGRQNPDGTIQINFEDLGADQGSDWNYNDVNFRFQGLSIVRPPPRVVDPPAPVPVPKPAPVPVPVPAPKPADDDC